MYKPWAGKIISNNSLQWREKKKMRLNKTPARLQRFFLPSGLFQKCFNGLTELSDLILKDFYVLFFI